MLRPGLLTISFLVCSSALLACSESSSKKQDTDDAGTGADGSVSGDGSALPENRVRITGSVLDAELGKAVAKAELTTVGGGAASSDTSGHFELFASDADLDVTVGLESFAHTYKPLPPGGGTLDLYLKRVDQKMQFRGDSGLTVDLPSGVRLEIPRDAVVDAEGKRVPELVTLELAAVDGAQPTQAAALPGDTTAEQKNKQAGRLSVDTGLSIRIFDAENRELTVDKNAGVVAEVPARKDAVAQIGVYSYDTKERHWKEESSAELSMNAENKAVYRADIDHLSWWSLGRFFDTLTCVRACVEDGDGKAVAGAQVWIVGKSQSGVSAFYTDETGCGASDAIANAEVVMVAQAEQLVSASKTVSLGNVNASAGTPDACQNAGTFTLGAAKACPLCEQNPGSTTGQTVTGKIVDGSGVAVAGAEVLINGMPAMSDTSGEFELPGVSVPYDLALIEDLDTDQRVTIYLDVQRLDPVLRVGRSGQHTASGSGLITGGVGFPIPPNHTTEITFRANGLISSFSDRQNPGDNATWMTPGNNVVWSGPTTISGTLFAIQFDSTALLFTGMASKNATFTSGQALSSPASDLALTNVTTRAVDVSTTLPQGANLTYYALGIGSFSRSVTNPGTTFSIDVPNGMPAAIPAKLILNAVIGTRTINHTADIGADATTLSAALSAPIQAVAPTANSPQLPADRTFRFIPQANSLTTVSLSWDDYDPDLGTGAYHSTMVYTDGNEIDLNEIVSLGADVSSGLTVSYSISGASDASDIDTFLAENRASSGVRTLSYEAGISVPLP